MILSDVIRYIEQIISIRMLLAKHDEKVGVIFEKDIISIRMLLAKHD